MTSGFPTGNEHRYEGDYSHCGLDVKAAIDKFEHDITDGTIRFDSPSVMPTHTPEDAKADEQVKTFYQTHDMIGDLES